MIQLRKYTCKSSRNIIQLVLVLVLITVFLLPAFLLPATTTLAASSDEIAHWACDEGSGSTAYDSTSYGNHGQINGASWTDDGVFSKALKFDHTDQVAVLDSASLDQPHVTGKITITMWAKKYASVTGWQPMLLKWGCYYLQISQNQKLQGSIWDNYTLEGNTVLSNGVWYHLAVTYNGSTGNITLYVNGQPNGSYNKTGSIREDTWPLHIGYSYYSSAAFPGIIDAVHVYSQALPQTDIYAQWAAGRANLPDHWKGYWTFDESTGSIADDVSGCLNNGNINGAELVQAGSVGTSLRFDGTDQVVVTDSASLDEPHVTGDITIEMWAKKYTNVTGWQPMLLKWGCYALEITADQKLRGTIWDNFQVDSSLPLANDIWYHLAMTFDGDTKTMKLYVDGREYGSGTTTNNNGIREDTWPLHLGRSYYTATFPGYLDEVRVYAEALPYTVISNHYANESPPWQHWDYINQYSHGGETGYASSSFAYYGSWWRQSRNVWEYDFKLSGM